MHEEITNLKKSILDIAFRSGEGHLGSSFSVLDLLFVLYDQVLNIDPKNPEDPKRDYFVLSKGHASLAHSCVLNWKGFINDEQLTSYCAHDSILGGHLNKRKVPGVEVSTGSLGHGIGVAVGIALAHKINQKSNNVYTIVGDGEINEGTFWESLLLISQHNLTNLSVIVDYNRSNDRSVKLDPLSEKLKAFGCHVITIDGHSHQQISEALSLTALNKPKAIIAETVKGHGIDIMENNPAWHHRIPSDDEYKYMLEELGKFEKAAN
jgi:transketolase